MKKVIEYLDKRVMVLEIDIIKEKHSGYYSPGQIPESETLKKELSQFERAIEILKKLPKEKGNENETTF